MLYYFQTKFSKSKENVVTQPSLSEESSPVDSDLDQFSPLSGKLALLTKPEENSPTQRGKRSVFSPRKVIRRISVFSAKAVRTFTGSITLNGINSPNERSYIVSPEDSEGNSKDRGSLNWTSFKSPSSHASSSTSTTPKLKDIAVMTLDFFNENETILRINWSSIKFRQSPESEFLPDVIGKGTFGNVIRASYTTNGEIFDVVVKILTKFTIGSKPVEYEKVLNQAKKEIAVNIYAESNISSNDNITKIYGLCEGPLPDRLCSLLKIASNTEAVGIVMRYEKGGALDDHIQTNECKSLSTRSKLILLQEIVKAISELHDIGIIHGDLKPGNILLDSANPLSGPRLADFGFAVCRKIDDHDHNYSSNLSPIFYNEFAIGGTPLYCAPEMLHNPYNDSYDGKVASASRATDMYAFAIIAWELLTGLKPFSEIRRLAMLGAKLHQGLRPDINLIPEDVPFEVRYMIECCWDGDRSQRKTAHECYNIIAGCIEGMQVMNVLNI